MSVEEAQHQLLLSVLHANKNKRMELLFSPVHSSPPQTPPPMMKSENKKTSHFDFQNKKPPPPSTPPPINNKKTTPPTTPPFSNNQKTTPPTTPPHTPPPMMISGNRITTFFDFTIKKPPPPITPHPLKKKKLKPARPFGSTTICFVDCPTTKPKKKEIKEEITIEDVEDLSNLVEVVETRNEKTYTNYNLLLGTHPCNHIFGVYCNCRREHVTV